VTTDTKDSRTLIQKRNS